VSGHGEAGSPTVSSRMGTDVINSTIRRHPIQPTNQASYRLGPLEAPAQGRERSREQLHDTRHTAATVLLLLGVHECTIMSILGWSSTAIVSRYAPIHHEVADRLDNLLWSSSEEPPRA
jgi:integrase